MKNLQLSLRLSSFALLFGLAGALGCASSMPVSAAVGASPSDSPLTVPISLSKDGQAAVERGVGHELSEHAPGELHVGVVAVEGGDVEDAASVAADLEGELQRCSPVRSQLPRDGELRVHAKIGPNGEVRFARSTGGDALEGSLVACVTGRVQTAQFAPPQGQDPTVVIPIAYRN